MHMDFFINIGLVGIAFIFLGKLTNKENKNIQEFNNLQFLNKLICYMESELFAKIHLKYGLQLLICGIISVFYLGKMFIKLIYYKIIYIKIARQLRL